MASAAGMKYLFATALILMLAACSDPSLGANIRLGPKGVSVSPQISGHVGGVGISVSG